MGLRLEEKVEILRSMGAESHDIDELLCYTSNVFTRNPECEAEAYLVSWKPIFAAAEVMGVAYAINNYLVRAKTQIDFAQPDSIVLELFNSFAGRVPIITAESYVDFENLVKTVVFKGNEYSLINDMGATFVSSKNNFLIILSGKPYSNVTAEALGLDEQTWKEKSAVIRKYHECAHYYTKRNYGSARNNLHDELIADFCGMWASFSSFNASLFSKFLAHGRMKIYTEGLSCASAAIVEKLSHIAASGVERWTMDEGITKLSDSQRIDYLCERELLSYVYHKHKMP